MLQQQQQHATPQADADTTNATDTTAPPVVIDQLSAVAAIDGLIQALAARDTASIEDAGDYEGFATTAVGLARLATTAVGLARLATAWHGYHKGPRQPAGRTVLPPAGSVDELRASLNILLSDPDMPDHGVTFSHESVEGFVWGLKQAITTCVVPSEEEMDEEAARAFRHLGWLALSLHEAAVAASLQLSKRVHDLKRARGEYPYDRGYSSPYRAVDKDLVAAVGKAIKDAGDGLLVGKERGVGVAEEGHEGGSLCAACQRCGAPLESDAASAGAPEDDHQRRHA